MALLEARDLTIRFGGVLALDVHQLRCRGRANPRRHRPQRRRQDHAAECDLVGVQARCRPDRDSTAATSPTWRRTICRALGVARTFQIVQPFNHMSVRENVAVGAMYGHAQLRQRSEYLDAADEALQRTGLIAKADFMPPHLTLSDRKRLEVARALAMKPRLLLLDEVMAGLNLTEIERTIELVRDISAAGITVIVIEHVMKAVLALCDRAMVLNFGRKLTEGKPHDVVNEPAVVEAYLGTRFAKSRAGNAA